MINNKPCPLQVAVEGERLRRLRERVEAQEQKLRRLRALRGQLDRNKQANIALSEYIFNITLLHIILYNF